MSAAELNEAIDIVRNGLFCGHTHEDILSKLRDLRDRAELADRFTKNLADGEADLKTKLKPYEDGEKSRDR